MDQIIEKRFFLGTVRVVCLTLLVVALAVVAIDVAEISADARSAPVSVDPTVAATDVLARIPGAENSNDLLSNRPDPGVQVPNADGFVIPAALKNALLTDDASQPVLNTWLGNVPVSARQGFLDELSVVVAQATQHAAAWEWDNRQRYVAAAMTEYARLKIDRITEAQNEQATLAGRDQRYMISAGVLVALIGVLTLLLILLAIERNTRPRVTTAGA
jgi:hypothetical protein